MKTIKDAVIELEGKLPDKHSTKRHNKNGWYISANKTLTHVSECVWFNLKEFESTAKRMGYINGYRYGVEYPTNGKRPYLPDDVLVEVKCMQNHTFSHRGAVGDLIWVRMTAFRVIDVTYNPLSEISESKPDDAAVSENSKSKDFEMGGNSWHDRGELPPVGTKCEGLSYNGSINEQWLKVKILDAISSRGDEIACVEIKSSGKFGALMWLSEFRPLTSDKERRIEMANIIFNECGRDLDAFISALDAEGMLVLPQKSGDTK